MRLRRSMGFALLSTLATLVSCAGPPSAPADAPAPPPAAPPPAVIMAPPPAPSTAEPAPDDEFAKVVIKVQKVAGNIYMLEGRGGNIGVSVGDDGIVVVDDQFAPLAPKIRAALRGIADKPVRFVLNTHWHGDHTGGNKALAVEATIVAHENVRKRLESGAPPRQPDDEATPPAPPEALPVVTFNDKLSLHVNGEEVRALHQPSGHTDGDTVIYFTKSNVVHMGDDFVTYGFPYVDVPSGGSVKGMIEVLERLSTELPADVKIIPGHGDVSTVADMKKLAATLRDCVRLVDVEVKKRKTLDQIKQAKVLEKYADLGKGFMKADNFVEIIYTELTRKAPAPAPAAKPKPAAH